jgi:hypothetical protein
LLRGSSTAFPVKKDEKNVKVIAGFYIGEKSYLADVSKDVSSSMRLKSNQFLTLRPGF